MQQTIHIELDISSDNDQTALANVAISLGRSPASAQPSDEIDLSDMPGRVVWDHESGELRLPPLRARRDRTAS